MRASIERDPCLQWAAIAVAAVVLDQPDAHGAIGRGSAARPSIVV